MKITLQAVVASKRRKKVWETYAKKFIGSLGIDYLISLEQEDFEEYDEPNAIQLGESNMGMGYSLEALKRHSTADLLWKLDDDVKGFTGDIAESLPEIMAAFERDPKLGAVVFPYSFEFYKGDETKMFTAKNARCQTSYIIRRELWHPTQEVSTFEDFFTFLNLVSKGYHTLELGNHKLKCKPVGKGAGGLQDLDRYEMAKKEVKLFQAITDIEIVFKKDKPWKIEPRMRNSRYKRVEI